MATAAAAKSSQAARCAFEATLMNIRHGRTVVLVVVPVHPPVVRALPVGRCAVEAGLCSGWLDLPLDPGRITIAA